MANGNGEGGLSLGRRVELLERKVKQQDRALKKRSCAEEDHYLRLVDKDVFVELMGGKEDRGRLLEVSKFTVLLKTDLGEKTINKGQIIRMSPVR